jgi:hypothetical protein
VILKQAEVELASRKGHPMKDSKNFGKVSHVDIVMTNGEREITLGWFEEGIPRIKTSNDSVFYSEDGDNAYLFPGMCFYQSQDTNEIYYDLNNIAKSWMDEVNNGTSALSFDSGARKQSDLIALFVEDKQSLTEKFFPKTSVSRAFLDVRCDVDKREWDFFLESGRLRWES